MAGGILSFGIMVFLKKTGRFGMTGVSMAGGVFHNIGQLLVAAAVVETGGIFYYIPPLLIAGVGTGFLIGIVSQQVLNRVFQDNER